MTYSVHVGKYRMDGPEWWFNFLLSTSPLISGKTWDDRVDECLKPYNACYFGKAVSSPVLIFDSEKDAMMFILRWS